MKYLKLYENFDIDPFEEEDWDEEEDIMIDHKKKKQDIPKVVNKRIVDLGGGKLGITNLDYTKVLTVEDDEYIVGHGSGRPEVWDEKKYKVIDHNGKPNVDIQYSLVKIDSMIWKKCPGMSYPRNRKPYYNPNRKCPEFDTNKFKIGDLLFKYCDPDLPNISDGRNYHVVGGVENKGNASLYTYWWTERRQLTYWGGAYVPESDIESDFGANEYYRVVKK